MAQNNQGAPARKQQTATAQQGPKLFTLNEVTHHLAVAKPQFDSMVRANSLPLQWEAEMAFARDLVMADERLRRVVPDTLAAALRNIAFVGLTLNPIKQHCKIIARWNNQTKVYEACFLPMYRGLVYLATQSGVADVAADVVYREDKFSIERRSDGDFYTHGINVLVPRGTETNPFIGAWVSARMPKTGARKVEWVPADDIYRMREQSESYKDNEGKVRPNSPWVKWFDEQAKKSALKRASKRWEEETYESTQWQRFQTAVDLDHKAEGGGVTIEGTAEETGPKLSIEQCVEIEGAASQLHLKDVNKYIAKICAAYGATVLSEVPASKHAEILERIKAAKAEDDKRAAAKAGAPKGEQPNETAKS